MRELRHIRTYLESDDYQPCSEFAPPKDASWSGIACHYLSLAVEVWCRQALYSLCEIANGNDEWRRWL